MPQKDTLKKLRAFGYGRSEDYLPSIQYKTVPTPRQFLSDENFKGKMLNHMIMENTNLKGCNYDEAAVTGSIFRNCKFKDCSMDQADFEFCEFYDCEFEIKQLIGCSFNSSSFINTSFNGVHFISCTFTNGFFQKCLFDHVEITNSTLEGALFKQCSFCGVDFRYLNMDYTEIEVPYMEDTVLPLSQIPFMFGGLQYLKNTKDNVYISKGNHSSMTPERFFKEVVPLLCEHFTKTKQFFPLANIYYALGDLGNGIQAIKGGLISAMSIRDFRMLKYFCKLIAYSGAFRPRDLHDLYNNYICRLYPQYSPSLNIPNYSRHMVEIKALLFSSAKRSSLRFSLKTDILLGEHEKLGKLFESLFALGKHKGVFQDNDIEAVLQQNSPLIVTIRISGEEEMLVPLLAAYLRLAGVNTEELQEIPVISQYRQLLPEQTHYGKELEDSAVSYRQELQAYSIHVILLEYYVENFQRYSTDCDTLYYFNSSALPSGGTLPR